MEKPAFTIAIISDVRVMRVPVVELPCQVSMGRIPVLKCLLSGTCGPLWPCLVVLGIKCRYFPRTQF
jgi:hypothetical protein